MDDKLSLESSTPVKKLHIHGMQHLDASLVTPTPEKTEETVNMRGRKETAELPEKYKLLSELFDGMTTSVRLLNLRKQLPIFHYICRQVETLTGRKFSYINLAQMKFILPEAVQTDKILLQNKKTFCMEPHLKVTFVFDVIEGHTEPSDFLALSRIFSSRLLKFVSLHSEDCDIPEAELPEPFNRKEITVSANVLSLGSSTKALPNVNEAELRAPSHFSPSFRRYFSAKDVKDLAETELSPSPLSPSLLKSDITVSKETGFSSYSDPIKNEKVLQVAAGDTPLKNPSVHGEITIETPDMSTPKRSVPTEDKLKSMVSQKSMASSLFAKRFLDFSKTDDGDEVLEGKTTSTSDLSVKEENQICFTSKNDVSTQSGLKAHRPASGLSDIAKTIHDIFQSAHCSSMTETELVYKILVNNLDIIDRGEVEEQIELLVNKVPDWISKKVDLSGDLMYNITGGLTLKSITEMLA
uniref:CDT1-like protein a, chloroplastic n=1 Tax=Erigeron canadensis TaxID=72917 RepID=UPI001CB8BC2F|nr:CDT1-like protein a, chloroplastic [Erigeron canadensis]